MATALGFPWGGDQSLTVGSSNTTYGDNSAIVGFGNSMAGTDYDWVGASDSLIVGSSNSTGGVATFIAGQNNSVTGDSYDGQTTATAVIGKGLISDWNNSLIVGQYNQTSGIPKNSGLLFAIGNGTNSSTRSNAVTVYNDGTMIVDGVVEVAPGGDIPMFSGN